MIRAAAIVLLLAAGIRGQDTRTVTEPVFPAVCAQLAAQTASVNGSLAAADETRYDTARIQTALNACGAGQAVKLAPAQGYDAFLSGPLRLPAGVTLWVDAGVTLFASRNARDYDANSSRTCGTVTASGGGCVAWITANRADGAGIVGYGVMDGRGYLPVTGEGAPSNTSWWDLANQANGTNQSQNCPRMLQISNTNGFTLYKITLKNSPNFHVSMGACSNVTIWGLKIITPYDARNTDAVDPGYSNNVTVTKCFLSGGDDNIAVGGNNAPGARNISVVDNWFGDGHGASIGSYTQAGVRDILFDRITIAGNASNGSQNAIRIKSDVSRGGLVENVTYSNMCVQNVRNIIVLDPFYTANATGNLIPNYRNITLRNIHAVTTGAVKIQGHDANSVTTVTLDNVVIDGVRSSDVPAQQYVSYTLGPGAVNFASMLRGTGVTVSDQVTGGTAPPACPAASFAAVAGELIPEVRRLLRGRGDEIRVQVVATKALPYQTYRALLRTDLAATLALPAPTGTVTIYDGSTAIGQAALNGGAVLSVPVRALAPGLHNLSAEYSGDDSYPGFRFGSYTVTIGRR